MTTALLFYLTITILLGLAVALFQYKPWLKSDKTYWILSILKALSIGALLLLLFNPKTNLNNSRIVKPKLCILLDNTQSVKFLNKDKTFKDEEELKDIFKSCLKNIYEKNIVFSCGSGVTACVLALAYSLINDKYHPCIYDGSWAEYGII